MSILSKVLHGLETPFQGVADSLAWIKSQFDKIVAASPDVAAAVQSLEAKAQSIETAAVNWADTAAGPALARLADKVADVIAAELPHLVGAAAGAAVNPAAALILSAAAEVATSIVHHEIAQFVASQAPAS